MQVPPVQTSSEQKSESGVHAVPSGSLATWQPRAGSHESTVHSFMSSQTSGVPAWHVPAWQLSSPLHTVPSGHGVPLPTIGFWQPDAGLQLFCVQGFMSSQSRGGPALQVPLWQVSSPLHTVPSGQGVPFPTALFWQPSTGSQESVVHTFVSSQFGAVPAVHEPLWQVSLPLQTVPSGQAEPFGALLKSQVPPPQVPSKTMHVAGVQVFGKQQTPDAQPLQAAPVAVFTQSRLPVQSLSLSHPVAPAGSVYPTVRSGGAPSERDPKRFDFPATASLLSRMIQPKFVAGVSSQP